jgi:AraC family transcriptional regulator of adaptative response/methylated-DNA-[protein]-cysteine methyltransferase
MTEPVRDLTLDDKWDAVRRRDNAYDGAFVFAVKTTGVYCRPSCASRQAKPENVSFFAGPAEARRAGFRACKRCRPDGVGEPDAHVALVRRACATIAAAEEPLPVSALAAEASLSPFHFHRVFK